LQGAAAGQGQQCKEDQGSHRGGCSALLLPWCRAGPIRLA